jgi:hypothetical protein
MKYRSVIIFIVLILCNLNMYAANLEITFAMANVSCYNGSNGSLSIRIINGMAPYDYKLCKLVKQQQQIIQKGSVGSNEIIFQNLKADTLYIELRDAMGDQLNDTIVISQPEPLKAGIISVVEVNQGIGKLKANSSGGIAPYTYKWTCSNGTSEGEYYEKAMEGIYKVDINDANNCGPVQATIFFVRQQYPEYFK